MDLLSYFRVLRRRWLLIVALVVIGGALGGATKLVAQEAAKERTYYKATHSLFLDDSSDGEGFQSAYTNLDKNAFLTTTGEVPRRVADELDGDETADELAERVITVVNGVTATLDIVVVHPDSDEAVRIADEFADQLTTFIAESDLARYNKQRDDLIARYTDLQRQLDSVNAQLAGQPNNQVLQSQRTSLANAYSTAYERFQSFVVGGEPTVPLSTLEDAEPVPIGEGEYNARIQRGQLGDNHLRTDSFTSDELVVPSSGSGSLESTSSRVALGAFLGLLAGIGLAVLLDRLDRRLRTREDVETAFALPVLAEVPLLSPAQQERHELVVFAQPLSRAAEAYRSIRSSLLFQRVSGPASGTPDDLFETGHAGDPDQNATLVVMVTSAAPGESKTTTAANLAAVFAETGSSVLLVNCDFRRPSVHRYFGVADEPRRVLDTQIDKLKLVTNVVDGPSANPAQVIAAQRQVVVGAKERFDVVVLDTAPVLAANDAVELVGLADLVVLVARANHTTATAAGRAVETLGRLAAPLSGVVFVGAASSGDASAYYYYQGPADATPTPSAVSNGSGTATERDLFPTGVAWSEDPSPQS